MEESQVNLTKTSLNNPIELIKICGNCGNTKLLNDRCLLCNNRHFIYTKGLRQQVVVSHNGVLITI